MGSGAAELYRDTSRHLDEMIGSLELNFFIAAESGVAEVNSAAFHHGKQDLYAGALIAALSNSGRGPRIPFECCSGVAGSSARTRFGVFSYTALPMQLLATVVRSRRVFEQQL